MSFTASHTIPSTGLQTFPTPDPAQPEGPRLEAGLEVKVLERLGDWARIACSNGWECWLNGTALVDRNAPVAPPAPPAPPVPSGPPTTAPPLIATAPPVRDTSPFSVALEYGLGPLTVAGAGIVAISSFFDWLSIEGFGGINPWDIPLAFLLTESSGRSGPKLGLFVFVSAVVVCVPLMLRRADRRFVLGGGIAAAVCVALTVFRLLGTDGLDFGFGLALGAIGAGLVLYDALVTKK